ncbi:MAG: ImmA/IrrE family metallo-endopeptidase [Planctomycetota bacterium]
MTVRVEITPQVIEWAVERSGKDISDFKHQVSDWVAGTKKPTTKQLREFASWAAVPEGYLYLDTPPDEEIAVPDYRTRSGSPVRRPSPELIDTVHDMELRQDWMRNHLLSLGAAELDFVGSYTKRDRPEEVAAAIRSQLDLAADWARSCSTTEKARQRIREAIGAAKILTFLNSVVGNNTSRKLDSDEFQGFVLVDRVAPLIFVNTADSVSAQIFTLAHEIAHLWLGESALFRVDPAAVESDTPELESFCNRVAAEFLVPKESLAFNWVETGNLSEDLRRTAKRYKVSPIVIGRRLKDLRRLDDDRFFKFYADYKKEARKPRKKDSGGGSFYQNQNMRLDPRFGRYVVNAVAEGGLTYRKAYTLTRLKGSVFESYAQSVSEGGADE